jgi:hypothetical protein
MESKKAAFAALGDEPIAGTVVVGDGETFDVGKALKEGGGKIVVDSGSELERSLVGYPGLESVPAGKSSSKASTKGGDS